MEIENSSHVDESDASKEFRLGILLVHGIGMQPQLATLQRWTAKLIEVINEANPNSPVASVLHPRHSHHSDDDFHEIEIELMNGHREKSERWLVTEGWWADAFPAPSFLELCSWSLRAVPWSIAGYLAAFRPLFSDKQGDEKDWDPRALPRRIMAFAILPVVVLSLGLLLLLGIPPIPRVRSWVMAAQSRLTATVGDSLAYIGSHESAGRMLSRILDPLRNLKERCDYTIIIAHSQGAALCVDALGGIEPTKPSMEGSEGATPDTLLTFGAGTNPLLNLRGSYPGLFSKIVWLEVLPIFAVLGLFGLLSRAVLLQEISVLHAIFAAGVAFASIVAALFVLLLAICVGYWITKKWPERSLPRFIVLGVISGVIVALVVSVRFDFPILTVFLVAAMFFVIFDVSDVVARALRKSAGIPSGLRRWVDLYASSDPVPNGPTRVKAGDVRECSFISIEIHNEGSILTDHTTYWENLDGFVLRVLHACADTARMPWLRHLLPANEAGERRAKWRVNHLRVGNWIVSLGSLFALTLFWNRFNDLPLLSLDAPEWIRTSVTFAPPIVILFAWVAAIVVLRLLWRRWVRAEQKQAIAGHPPDATPWRPFVQMGGVIGLIVLLVAAAGFDGNLLQMTTVEWAGLILLSIVVGIGLELLARWWLKAPAIER